VPVTTDPERRGLAGRAIPVRLCRLQTEKKIQVLDLRSFSRAFKIDYSIIFTPIIIVVWNKWPKILQMHHLLKYKI
jgi:hypothetical protein